MSNVYQNIITSCYEQINAALPCEACTNGNCLADNLCSQACVENKQCIKCLGDICYDEEHRYRTYNCLPITYTYVLRFLNKYATEIYRILLNSEDLLNCAAGGNIVSVGCGPGTELVGLERFLRERNLFGLNYYGFDKNRSWNKIQEIVNWCTPAAQIEIHFNYDLLAQDNPVLANTQLLILNYLLSDIYKHGYNDKFDDEAVIEYLSTVITPIAKKLPLGSVLIINDVNSYKMGRTAIQGWCSGFTNSEFEKYFSCFHSSYWSEYYNEYRDKNFDSCVEPGTEHENSLIFSEPSTIDMSQYKTKIIECTSAFIILKKVGVI